MITVPGNAEGPHDVTVRPFRCWSPSCRRCGPIVGAQDLARLSPAIEGRSWVYCVATLGPRELARGRGRARVRAARARREWLERVEPVIGAAPPIVRERLVAGGPWVFSTELAGDTERDERRRWLTAAREVEPPPRGARLSPNAYHVAATAWTDSFLRRCRHRWGALEHVVTWEAQRSGMPHANILLRGPGLTAELAELEVREGVAKGNGRRRRVARYAPELRSLMRRWAIASGFGRVFWCEIGEAGGPALALYVAKLARELMCPSAKGQAPTNRPRGFRRYSTSKGLLEVRHWPKATPVPCPVDGCEELPPCGAWHARNLRPHLEHAHGWSAEAARRYVWVRTFEHPTAAVRVLERAPDELADDDVAEVVAKLGTGGWADGRGTAIAAAIRDGDGSPTRIRETPEP